jgi:urease accessory protein
MSVITDVLGNVADFKDRIREQDPLLLNSEERASPHMLGHTEGGRDLRISMPRGTELNDGDVLALDGDVAIVVQAAAEELFIVCPNDALSWGVAGYQLGNLHRPVRFREGAMLTPADAMVADMLGRLDIPYERKTMPFVGKRYGSHTGGHHHEH